MSTLLKEHPPESPQTRVVAEEDREQTARQIRAEWAAGTPTNHPRKPPPEYLADLWDSYFRLAERADARRWAVLDSILAHQATFGLLEYRRSEFMRTGC